MEVGTSFGREDLFEQITLWAISDLMRCFLKLQSAHAFLTAEEPAGMVFKIFSLSRRWQDKEGKCFGIYKAED